MHAFRRIARVVALQRELISLVRLVASRILGRNNHLVSISPFLHPLTNKPFRVLAIIGVGRVYEIATQSVEGIKQRVCIFVFTKYLAP